MITVILLVIVGGISLSQAVSDPHQVTLRWLRLGGIIAVTLLAVAVTIEMSRLGRLSVGSLTSLARIVVAALKRLNQMVKSLN